jgi:hypothetical protein
VVVEEPVVTGVVVEEPVVTGVGVGVVPTAVVAMHGDALMVSSMRVTSPFRANTRPSTVTPEPRVIEVIQLDMFILY